MNDKIDAVILFVDMNDGEWREKYNKYIEEHEIPNKHINNETRFRDYGSLLGVLRSIDMYASWINNVFLVVQSESQVPKWINRETVKVVLHEDFIPKEYLPTFNCNTIETHLHLIPGLSEKFIYFNDDMLINRLSIKEDFFINNKCVHYMIKSQTNSILSTLNQLFYRKLRFSNIKVLNNIFKEICLDNTYYNSHGPTPMLKTLCNEVYNKIDIKYHTTVFRENKNLTQELFTVYALYRRRLILLENSVNTNINAKLTNKKNGVDAQYTFDNHDYVKKTFWGCDKKTFCMNDVFMNEEIKDKTLLTNEIEKIILKKFSKISKYEKK